MGSLMMFAAGSWVSAPRKASPSSTCCSCVRQSPKAASTLPAREISVILMSMPAAEVNLRTIGSKEQVASDGASSVRV